MGKLMLAATSLPNEKWLKFTPKRQTIKVYVQLLLSVRALIDLFIK